MFRDVASVFARLLDNVVWQESSLSTECWIWTKGCCNKGYGHFYVYDPAAIGHRGRLGKSVEVRAHIASWVLANGPIPAELTLDHLCRNTRCIRPSHLELVTRPENTRRGNAARRSA